MLTSKKERVFAVPAQDIWTAAFFVEEYCLGIYEAIAATVELVTQKASGEWPALMVTREQIIEPDRTIPAALHKLVRGATRVRERAEFNGVEGWFRVSMQLPVIGKLVDFNYEYRWIDLPDRSTKMLWRGECNARLPLLKKRAESFLIDDLTKSVVKAGDFTENWFQNRPPAG